DVVHGQVVHGISDTRKPVVAAPVRRRDDVGHAVPIRYIQAQPDVSLVVMDACSSDESVVRRCEEIAGADDDWISGKLMLATRSVIGSGNGHLFARIDEQCRECAGLNERPKPRSRKIVTHEYRYQQVFCLLCLPVMKLQGMSGIFRIPPGIMVSVDKLRATIRRLQA